MSAELRLQSMQEQANRWAFAAAAATASITLAVLGMWLAGTWTLGTFGAEYVPMAPATAMLLLLLALAMAVRARAVAVESALVPVFATVAFLVATAFAVANALGVEISVERWMARTDASVGGIAVGRMSIYSALLLALLALGILGRYLRWRATSEGIAIVVLIVGVFVLQGYVFGAPPIYGGTTIPVAALTALCVVLIAGAQILTAGVSRWPLRLLIVSEDQVPGPVAPRAFWALALLAGLVVLTSGYFWNAGERARTEARAEQMLIAVADLKAQQLGVWLAGHLSTARAVQALPVTPDEVRRWASAESARSGATALDAWLAALQVENDYAAAALFAADGALVAVSPPDYSLREAALRERLAALAEQRNVVIDDIHADGPALLLKLWVPIGSANGSRAAAWLLLDVDVRRSLFPLLETVDLGTPTAKMDLWRRDGDAAVLLNDGTERGVPALGTRVPIDSASQIVAVQGLLGRHGVVTGHDYRGVPVVSAVRPIPGRPWVLAAKVNRAELAAPVVRSAVRATVVTLLLVLAAVTAVYALWSRRRLAVAARELRLVRDREQSLDELRLSEARYARAMRGTSDGLWDWEIASGALYVSEHWIKMLGGGDLDLSNIKVGFFDRVHPEDLARVWEKLEAHFTTGAPYDIELRIRHADDTYHWFWSRGEAERDARGVPIRMSGAITDISVRRATEDALRRTERILRVRSASNLALVRARSEEDLLQAVCDVAVSVGGYRMAWAGYAEHDERRSVRPLAIAGYEEGYLTETPITWDERDDRGRGPTGRCIRTGEPQVAQDLLFEAHYSPWRAAASRRGFASSCSIPLTVAGVTIGALMLYSGEAHAFNVAEVALLTELGNDLSFGIGALRDRRAVADQQAQLALFRRVIERSDDAMFVADAETGRFIDFNEAAARQLGYSREELLKLGPRDISTRIAEEDSLSTVVAAAGAEGPVKRSAHRRKDGSVFPVEVALTPIPLGERTVVLGVARDISERVRTEEQRAALEQQLQQAQKLESVGRLAGGVAHDFNNLLTVINATADLALGEVAADSRLRQDLLEIRTAGERAAALTQQLVALSRQQLMRREILILNDVINGFLKLLRRVIGEDIEICVRLDEQLAAIDADPGQLEQVLMNICVNARDAMPRGGTLTVATENVTVDETNEPPLTALRPGRYVRLEITDTGEGMSPDVQAKIFEPFFTTKPPGKGSGLGLATVYGIINQTGGSIWVTSEVGVGTTFTLHFPAVAPPAARQASAPSIAVPSGSETILLVEDEAGIRAVARRVLTRAGYTVLEAASGHDALKVVADHPGQVHLVMTDIVMPGMSGIQLAEALVRDHPRLRILLTTGYSADAVAGRFDGTAEWSIISKPYALSELLGEVRRILGSQA